MPAQPSTTLLHVSDLHACRSWFDWVAEQAQHNCWAVAISGDLLHGDANLGYSEFRRALKHQATWISNWVRAVRFPLFICSGNHDTIPDDDAAWLHSLARPGVTVNGCGHLAGRTIACLPWDCGPEAFLKPEILAADIWLHHQPPSECGLSSTGSHEMDFGSDDLVAALLPAWGARARLILGGHVHAATCWHARCGQALCFNAADPDFSAIVPKHIVIDLSAGTAVLNHHDQRDRILLQPWAVSI